MHSRSIIRTLATEEKDKIVSIAVRPGKVDTGVRFFSFFFSWSRVDVVHGLTRTQMQSDLRDVGAVHMAPDVYESFVREKEEGLLLKPEDPGHVIAALAVNGPRSLSGEFVNWDDERCREFRRPA